MTPLRKMMLEALQAELFQQQKLTSGTINNRLATLRFFYIKTLKKGWSIAETPYSKRALHLPSILSQEEVRQLIDAALTPYHRILLLTLYATGVRNAELTHLKVSDIDLPPSFRASSPCAGAGFIERKRQWLSWKHIKVVLAIARSRTAALGGHLDQCTRCGHRATISYNSCRDRHCPKCQTAARERWIAARQRELLPTCYVHVVFTLPLQLAPLALQNKKVIYDLLFRASAETLLEVARDPKHLGAEIGFFTVLHTWNQKLGLHPPVHCVIPAGGLSLDHTQWVKSRDRFFLPIHVLRRVFRGKFVAALKQAFRDHQLVIPGNLTLLAQPSTFAAWLWPLFRKDWVIYSKPLFGGPEYVLQYLGRYTHRVAISNHRLVSFAEDKVTFRWRDSAHNNEQKALALSLDEFLRRFLLHVLPKDFVRIQNFGLLANRRRAALLPLCFHLLGSAPQAEPDTSGSKASSDLWLCPKCGGPMMVIERLTAAEIQLRSPPPLVTEAA